MLMFEVVGTLGRVRKTGRQKASSSLPMLGEQSPPKLWQLSSCRCLCCTNTESSSLHFRGSPDLLGQV